MAQNWNSASLLLLGRCWRSTQKAQHAFIQHPDLLQVVASPQMRGILPAAVSHDPPLSQRHRYMLLNHWESRWLRWVWHCMRAPQRSLEAVFFEGKGPLVSCLCKGVFLEMGAAGSQRKRRKGVDCDCPDVFGELRVHSGRILKISRNQQRTANVICHPELEMDYWVEGRK